MKCSESSKTHIVLLQKLSLCGDAPRSKRLVGFCATHLPVRLSQSLAVIQNYNNMAAKNIST